ncbi:MAG TPA: class I SAM-dependent methyltransferase [Pirellulales bacterium]|jgi:SAM-dependent methyltransferase|nr:class I SAM-dependent methyltransferase [Pirellulales bacterium]
MPTENDPARPFYLFGDSDLAAERLRLLAEVFAPSTREFLEGLAVHDPRRILDLGCGPGYTTRLLADVFPRADVLGLDNSDAFIEIARQTHHERVAYQLADVTQPLPGGPYDLIYCRYLLTHLKYVEPLIIQWAAHLLPSGLLAIEENDRIETQEAAFEQYLAIAEAMLHAGGYELYIGAKLERSVSFKTLSKKSSECVPIVVENRDAARMFMMNLDSWTSQSSTSAARRFVEKNFSRDYIERLRGELGFLADGVPRRSPVCFGRRRFVFQRRQASTTASGSADSIHGSL